MHIVSNIGSEPSNWNAYLITNFPLLSVILIMSIVEHGLVSASGLPYHSQTAES